jgi:hypothetical protein
MALIQGDINLRIPQEQLNYIDKNDRPKYFLNIVNEYKNRYPEMKLIYCFLNIDPKCPVDFVLLFSTRAYSQDKKHCISTIVYDIPLIYTDRSIPGYRYCLAMDYNPGHKATIQYLGSMYILINDIDKFNSMIKRYYGTKALPSLPKSFKLVVDKYSLHEKDCTNN